ncbi:hypothetical protein MKZ38_010161 [Zalerion maritima]|uniref:Uncharacterized protein n=1 Tax=Zalerion maritima TaxID=339359 RepID=A0AAD5S0Y0_9PEZI|nr:hypothetical protein MKZ38_010161 [Zalerion maritima]
MFTAAAKLLAHRAAGSQHRSHTTDISLHKRGLEPDTPRTPFCVTESPSGLRSLTFGHTISGPARHVAPQPLRCRDRSPSPSPSPFQPSSSSSTVDPRVQLQRHCDLIYSLRDRRPDDAKLSCEEGKAEMEEWYRGKFRHLYNVETRRKDPEGKNLEAMKGVRFEFVESDDARERKDLRDRIRDMVEARRYMVMALAEAVTRARWRRDIAGKIFGLVTGTAGMVVTEEGMEEAYSTWRSFEKQVGLVEELRDEVQKGLEQVEGWLEIVEEREGERHIAEERKEKDGNGETEVEKREEEPEEGSGGGGIFGSLFEKSWI